MGRSVRATALMTIFVTASQPTLGCLASCCTSLSEATPAFTSPAPLSEVRSMSVGKVFARPMFTSRPDRPGANCATAIWQSSTEARKTFRSAPTGLPNACWMARQIPAKASSGPMPAPRRADSSWLPAALPKALSAASTSFSSPALGERSESKMAGLQPAQAARVAGTSQAAMLAESAGAAACAPEAEAAPVPSTCSGSFRRRRTCENDLAGTSFGNAATQASRPGSCCGTSPRLRRWALQMRAKRRADSWRTVGSLWRRPSARRSHSPG
mmetsp:Transcript_84567/g.187818  ORF Transcript_84567/g.187818 Transcript_84567/m.187818 type:complete len:270 (-) Transcript_84567:581-1390(-)